MHFHWLLKEVFPDELNFQDNSFYETAYDYLNHCKLRNNSYLPMAIKQAAKRPAPGFQISLVKRYTDMEVIPLWKNNI